VIRRLASTAVILACLFPFALMAMLSAGWSWPFPNIFPLRWTAGPWRAAFHGRDSIASTFGTSCLLSATVALIATAGAFLTARFIAYHRRRRALLVLAYVPYVMSPVVLSVCLLYLYIRAGIDGTAIGVVLAQTILAFSFGTIFFVDFWNDEKLALEQLVATLGGSTIQLYRRVLLPLSRGPLLLCFFETFLISWFQYGTTLLIGEGKVQTLSLRVFAYVNEANPAYAALASCLLVMPPVLLLWVNKRIVRSMA
jgi:ABC-type spermidine/putrescine transport system permease subunit II